MDDPPIRLIGPGREIPLRWDQLRMIRDALQSRGTYLSNNFMTALAKQHGDLIEQITLLLESQEEPDDG